jgi:hypothetical protein
MENPATNVDKENVAPLPEEEEAEGPKIYTVESEFETSTSPTFTFC